MPGKLHLNRTQLEAFLGKDHDKIKQFERLIGLVQDYLNSGTIDDTTTDATFAAIRANEVAAGLQELSDRLGEMIPVDTAGIEARLAVLEERVVQPCGPVVEQCYYPITPSYVTPVGEGGTGNTSTPANGEMLIGNGLGFTLNSLTAGANIVITPGAGTVTIAGNAGTVTSVDVSGGSTGLTFSGGPITTSGTITMAGTLGVANGGTAIVSYAVGDLIYASGSTTLSKLADVATGNALISGGVTTAPAWGKIGLTTHVSGVLPTANGGNPGYPASTADNGVPRFDGSAGATQTSAAFIDDTGTIIITDDLNGYGCILPRYSSGYGGSVLNTSIASTFCDFQVAGVTWMRAFSVGVGAFQAPVELKSYAVATLPAASVGWIAYATDLRVFNGLGVQELPGAGTGGIVSYNGTIWTVAGTNALAVA